MALEQELRIAPVMTGGTSLAVWMGGATTELYRLLRCRRETDVADPVMGVYRALLRITDTTPVVDVITGTSAGGLNGTLLAAATMLNLPFAHFSRMRETWLDVADLEKLLRSPHEQSPPSLLKGDDHFIPEVERLLDSWRRVVPERDPSDPDAAAPVDLLTTVTTVTAEPKNWNDDFDETMSEQNHAQWLRFWKEKHFSGDEWTRRLAIAARTSASIPGVFEPSFLPVNAEDAKASQRPDFKDIASFKTSRWAVDGGLVVNLPLTEAVDRIYAQSGKRQIRRALLYVCPTPSGEQKSTADTLAKRPAMVKALALVATAPRAEGISADVERIRAGNERVRRQRYVRQTSGVLAELAWADEASAAIADVYRSRRRIVEAGALVALLAQAGVALPMTPDALERELAAVFPFDPRRDLRPAEEAVSIALGLIARGQALLHTQDASATAAASAFEAAKEQAHAVRERLANFRAVRDAYVVAEIALVVEPLPDLTVWARAVWAGLADVAGGGTPEELEACQRDISNAVARAAPYVLLAAAARGGTATSPGDVTAPGTPAATEAASATALLDELYTIAVDSSFDAPAIRAGLYRVHVVQTVALGEVDSREQIVELMQLSWNSFNALDQRPKDAKLAGPELARLGAFLKRSWRANDWCWGRMDAAYRLALLILDPKRLRQLDVTPEQLRAKLEAPFAPVAEALAPLAQLPPDVTGELAFLTDSSMPMPPALPKTAGWVARALQIMIGQEELPFVAAQVDEANRAGAVEGDGGAFRRRVDASPRVLGDPDRLAPRAVAPALNVMQIGQETISDEFGSRLMNRVMSQGASVVVNAATGTENGVPVVPRLLRPLRAPLHGVNSIVRVISGSSPLARGLTSVVLATAGAIVAVRVVGVPVPAGTFALSATLLLATVLIAMVRSGFVWLGVCFTVLASVIGLALLGDDIATVVYSGKAAEAQQPIAPGSVITIDESAILDVITGGPGDSASHSDVTLEPGEQVKLRSGRGTLQGTKAVEERAGWKTWGFTREWNALRLALWVLAAAVLLEGVLKLRRTRWLDRVRPLAVRAAVAGSLVVAGLAARRPFEDLLTGTAPTGGAKDPSWKGSMVDLATNLGGFKLELVLVALVLVGVLLSFAADLVVARIARGMRRWVVLSAKAGVDGLRGLLGPPKADANRIGPFVLVAIAAPLAKFVQFQIDSESIGWGLARQLCLLLLVVIAVGGRVDRPRAFGVWPVTRLSVGAAVWTVAPVGVVAAAVFGFVWFTDAGVSATKLLDLVFVTALGEELLYRGGLLVLAYRAWKPAAAEVATAVAFGLFHVANALQGDGRWETRLAFVLGTVAFTTAGGFLFTWLRHRTRWIGGSWLGHVATNLASVVVR